MTCLSDYLAASNQGPCHALIEFIDVLTEPLLTSYRPETKKPLKDCFGSGSRKRKAAAYMSGFTKQPFKGSLPFISPASTQGQIFDLTQQLYSTIVLLQIHPWLGDY
jgi:hypothetical protein